MPTNPQAFSDEDAEQFASSFKPAWQTDEDEATSVGDPPVMPAGDQAPLSNTIVMDRPEAAAAAATAASAIAEAVTEKAAIPDIAKLGKASKMQTVIGLAAPPPPTTTIGMVGSKEVTPVHPVPRPPSSAEVVEPDQVLEVVSAGDTTAKLPGSIAASSPNVAAAAAVSAASSNAPPAMRMGMGTQVMANRPMMAQAPVVSRPPPAGAAAPVSADPFKTRARASSSSDFEAFKPKKSNKAIIIAVIGVVALIGLGVGVKTFIGDDSHDSPKNEPLVTGPAATTNDIPPPPPPSETATATPAAAVTTAPAATTAAAVTASPPPVAATPPQRPTPVAVAPQPAPVRNDPPRFRPAPPPATPAPAAAPKSTPKTGNGGIVRDNPF